MNPIFFTILGVITVISGEREKDRLGYLALARIKGRHFDPEPFLEGLLEMSPMLNIHLGDSEIHRDEARKSLREFYGKGAGGHLLNHLMLQDLLDCDDDFSAEQAILYLSRQDELMPLLLKLESGLSDIISSEGKAPNLTGLFFVLGAYPSPETLPLLLKGLEWCTGSALNEAVLSLARMGYRHPHEVTTAVRDRIEGDVVQEGLINAVEVLGMLGPLEGNYGYLKSRAQALNPRNPIHREMLMFTAGALHRSGEPGLVEESARLIEQITPFLDFEEAHQASMLLGAEEARPVAFPAEPPLGTTMTMKRETSLQELERPDAFASLEDYWFYREGWEFYDESCLDTAELSGLSRHFHRLLIKMRAFFAKPEFGKEASLALREFLYPSGRKRLKRDIADYLLSPEELAFYDWALVSRPLSEHGHSLTVEYLKRYEQDLWEEEIAYLKALAASRLSLFEVLEVEPQRSLRVRDIFRGDTCSVRNEAVIKNLEPSGAVIMRIGEVRGVWEIMGCAFPVPGEVKEELEKLVRDLAEKFIRERKTDDIIDFLAFNGHQLYFCLRNLSNEVL